MCSKWCPRGRQVDDKNFSLLQRACLSRNFPKFSTNWILNSCTDSGCGLCIRSLRCPHKKKSKCLVWRIKRGGGQPFAVSKQMKFPSNGWCNLSVRCRVVCGVAPSCWIQISFGLIPLLVKFGKNIYCIFMN